MVGTPPDFLSCEVGKPLSAPDYSQFKWSIAILANDGNDLNYGTSGEAYCGHESTDNLSWNLHTRV